jgi:ArsR family transcriptional regulator, arsenate/arsenite/antimonite-responsive transcriptional repressor
MDKGINQVAGLFQALGDPTRLRILALLGAGEVCVCDIHESLREPQPKISRHLAYLRKANLVDTRRAGLWVHYRLAEVPDSVLATIRAAVLHSLTHVESIRRDTQRLVKRTGCCLPKTSGVVELACCSAAGRETRA